MSDSTMTGSQSASNRDLAPAKLGQNGSGATLTDVKELGGRLATAARKGANSLYEEQRNRAATEIAALGKSLGRSAKSLDGTVGEAVAPYATDAARQVEDFADTLRDKSLSDLSSDVEGFARQWPMAFVAGAVAVGFVAGRFLLSSSKPTESIAGSNNQPQGPGKTESSAGSGPTKSAAAEQPTALGKGEQ